MGSRVVDDRQYQHRAERDTTARAPKRRRSRSPHRDRGDHIESVRPVRLPFGAAQLRKRDFETCTTLFADYLDLQKQLELSSLSETEAKGRWKSFMGKWNRGELSEGWYDPKTKERADARAAEEGNAATAIAGAQEKINRREVATKQFGSRKYDSDDEDGEDDDLGPSLPPGARAGPNAPNTQDLQLRRELQAGDRESQQALHKAERKEERSLAQSRLDDLAPRAAAGTRDRQIERRREQAFSNKAFAESKDAGVAEVPESDLLGASGVDEYKAEVQKNQRKQSEREIRKEEVLKARAVEREEKVAEFRRKEDKTMEMLRGLARERFGAGG